MNRKIQKLISLTAAGVLAAAQASSAALFTSVAADDMAATKFPYTIEGEDMEDAELWETI